MQLIEIELGPPWPTYNSFSESIAGADAQPEQVAAKRDSREIAGAVLESGHFGLSSCLLSFSNGRHLFVEARDFRVEWSVLEGEVPEIHLVPARDLRFVGSDQSWLFDPIAVISEITNSELVMLAATGPRLLVYTKGNEILWLTASREHASGRDLVYADLGS